jgi:hypothetical protein
MTTEKAPETIPKFDNPYPIYPIPASVRLPQYGALQEQNSPEMTPRSLSVYRNVLQ